MDSKFRYIGWIIHCSSMDWTSRIAFAFIQKTSPLWDCIFNWQATEDWWANSRPNQTLNCMSLCWNKLDRTTYGRNCNNLWWNNYHAEGYLQKTPPPPLIVKLASILGTQTRHITIMVILSHYQRMRSRKNQIML